VGCGPSEGELYKKLGRNTTYVSNGVAEKEIDITENNRNLISFTGIASLQKDPGMWSAIASACANTAAENGFTFCWIGSGPEAGELKRDYIDFTGWKSPEEVEKLHERTAVFLSASAWEGLPYGVLEAMSSGCALLLRNIPGHRDLVIPGENGRLFDTCDEAVRILAEKLTEMISKRARLAEMGKKSAEIVRQKYSLKQMGEGYRKIYTSIGVKK